MVFGLIAAIAVLALGAFFVIRAPRLAHDEATTLQPLRAAEGGRRVGYRVSGAFLILVGVAVLISAVR